MWAPVVCEEGEGAGWVPKRLRGAASGRLTPRRAAGGRRGWPAARFSPSPLRYVPVPPRDGSISEQSRRRRAGEGGRRAGAGAGIAGAAERGPVGLAAGGEEGRVKSSVKASPRSRTRCLILPSSIAWSLAARRGGWLPSGVFRARGTYTECTPGSPGAVAVALLQSPSEASAACGKGRGTHSAFLKLVCLQADLVNLFGRRDSGRESGSTAHCRGLSLGGCLSWCPNLDLKDTHGFSDHFSISKLILI